MNDRTESETKKKKFLLVTLEYPPQRGGIATYLGNLTSVLEDHVDVLVNSKETPFFFSWMWPKWVRLFFLLRSKQKEYKGFIVSHIHPIGLVARLVHLLHKKPYIVIMHGMDFQLSKRNAWKKLLTRWVLKSAKLVVVNTYHLKQQVQKFCEISDIQVIYPCPQERFFIPNREKVRDNIFRLITVGRLVPRKGHALVLEAISQLSEDLKWGMRYTIVGDGLSFKELQMRSKELHLGGVVTFARGASDEEVVHYLAQSSAFIMPTFERKEDVEGFGTVYLEAAALGIPSIASRLPGVDEAVIDGETGALVTPNSIEEIRQSIERYMQNTDLLNTHGNAARIRAEQYFRPNIQFEILRSYVS